MIKGAGIDFHQGRHVARCLDEKAQLCDGFSFQTAPEGLSTLEEPIFRDGSNPVAESHRVYLACQCAADLHQLSSRVEAVDDELSVYFRGNRAGDKLDGVGRSRIQGYS